MSAFWTLYGFELKKLMKKKAIRITIILCVLAFVITILAGTQGDYYVNGERYSSVREIISMDREKEEALSGTPIDQQLLQKVWQVYHEYLNLTSQVENSSDQTISQTALSESFYTRQMLNDFYLSAVRPYKDIWSLLQDVTGMTATELDSWSADETAFYTLMEKNINTHLHSVFLTEDEITFWNQQWKQIETPVIYSRTEAYDSLLTLLYTFGVVLVIFIAVCLSGIFPEEHARRTDQLILCSIRGKTTLYLAKLAAGISFTFISALGMCLLVFVMFFAVYGTTSFDAPFLLLRPNYPYPLTVGQALLIGYGMMLVTAVLLGICVMVFSELIKNSIFTLALTIALLLAGMLVNIPEHCRILAQIWDWMPHCILAVWNIFDLRLLPVFGRLFTAWQALPVIYLLACVPIVLCGKLVYQKYQITGR